MCIHYQTLIWQGPHNKELTGAKLPWVVSIMAGTSVVKLGLMLYCWSFKNEIVRTYGKDHMFDVITNVLGLGAALLATWFYWWIDPTGAIIVRAPSNLFS
jgi:divalent metal cation (Fe/Co/Zn/Cd) transporter